MDKKEKLTKNQLIEKINNERQTFKTALLQKDEELAANIAKVKQVSNMVIGHLAQQYGVPEGDEYILDIDIPREPMLVGAEPTETGYRFHCRKCPEI